MCPAKAGAGYARRGAEAKRAYPGHVARPDPVDGELSRTGHSPVTPIYDRSVRIGGSWSRGQERGVHPFWVSRRARGSPVHLMESRAKSHRKDTMCDSTKRPVPAGAPAGTSELRAPNGGRLAIAINLLTEDPGSPSGAHWFWTRVIPEMSARLGPNEELRLMVSPKSRPPYQGYGSKVRYVAFRWSNEHRNLRSLSEHLRSPLRLPSVASTS